MIHVKVCNGVTFDSYWFDATHQTGEPGYMLWITSVNLNFQFTMFTKTLFKNGKSRVFGIVTIEKIIYFSIITCY